MVAGGISIVVSYVFAEPIMDLMYHSPQSAVYVHVMAPLFFLFYFQSPLAAVLQALDLAKAAMINSFIGAFVKIVTIFALASRPELGIMGAALGYAIGVVLVTLLHLTSVIKSVGFSLVISDFLKGAFACVATGIFATYCDKHFWTNMAMLPRTLILITLSIIFYILLILIIKLIKRNEMEHLPIIRKWLV